jgi:enoyl-CoA hydratase/carnithine racemase
VKPSYFNSYENLAMERTGSGILTVRLHTDGGPIVFTGQTHHDLPRALAEIGEDRENKVMILTGTGAVFMDEIDGASLGEIFKPAEWDKGYWEGRRVMQRLLEIEAPIIAAINGPATVHSEYVLLADITIASEDATFADKPHMGLGIVPGDGLQVIYEENCSASTAPDTSRSPSSSSTHTTPTSSGSSTRSCPRVRSMTERSPSRSSSPASPNSSCATPRSPYGNAYSDG